MLPCASGVLNGASAAGRGLPGAGHVSLGTERVGTTAHGPLCSLTFPTADAPGARAVGVVVEPSAAPPSSSGPGHRPFKAAARVRIPLGARSATRGMSREVP